MFRMFRKKVFPKRPISLRRFLRDLRRRRIVREKSLLEMRYKASRSGKKYTAQQLCNELVRLSQGRGIKRADGSIANLENRWVRKALFRNGELYMRQINAKIAAKKALMSESNQVKA